MCELSNGKRKKIITEKKKKKRREGKWLRMGAPVSIHIFTDTYIYIESGRSPARCYYATTLLCTLEYLME